MSLDRLRRLERRLQEQVARGPGTHRAPWSLAPELGRQLLESMLLARHLDLASHELSQSGQGVYTIASSGHEANAVLGRLTLPGDPTMVHYRSGALFLERARQVPEFDAVRAVCLSLVAARSDPISGGRHKVFGHKELGIIPQTSTIGSHLPRATGMAFALELGRRLRSVEQRAIVVAGFGDASVNHSTWLGAVNAAGWAVHRGLSLPLLLVCEDNGLGISVRSPPGWVCERLRAQPHVAYFHAAPGDIEAAYRAAGAAVRHCREKRLPAVLHLECVRLLGHWGGDRDELYRTPTEIDAAQKLDPVLCLALSLLQARAATAEQILAWNHAARQRVSVAAAWAREQPKVESLAQISTPLSLEDVPSADPPPTVTPEGTRGLSLLAGIKASLDEALQQTPEVLVFGEDVGTRGGLFGATRGLQAKFGAWRVFDTPLDEQTILGVALGTATLGWLPIAEIQYLAFLNNALDQLRGEALMIPFLSQGAYTNPMVVRIPSFARPDAPGGHFHNDNSIGALRDIPGLLLAVPSRADDALGLVRTAIHLARTRSRVIVLLEPTALYSTRDLHDPGDGAWLASPPDGRVPLGQARVYGPRQAHLVIATYGRGTWLSLRAARRLQAQWGLDARVLDLRWLSPLPVRQVLEHARAAGRLLAVDDCRPNGGVADSLGAAVAEQAPNVRFARVGCADCFLPIGHAAKHAIVQQVDIEQAARRLCFDAT